jgi:predicted dehydrogenase
MSLTSGSNTGGDAEAVVRGDDDRSIAAAPVGVAVLGAGAIAAEHVLAFDRLGDASVRYVVSDAAERAEEVSRRALAARATTSLAEALGDPLVHLAVVCGRTATHLERANAAISAGKHVLIEKPPALAVAPFRSLVARARGAGRHLMVAQTARFQPAVAAIGAAVTAGDIGRPRFVHASWYVGHVWPGGWRSWQLDPSTSGGHLAHNGMHPIDTAIWLLGQRPVRIFARGWSTHAAEMPTPDSFHLTVRFDDGSLALLETSYGLRPRGAVARRLLVAGTDGTIEHDSSRDPRPSGSTAPPLSVQGAMEAQAAHLVSLCRQEVSPLVTTDHSLDALAAALAAQRSFEAGRPIDVDLGDHA